MKKLILISIVAIVSIFYSCEDSKSPVITDTKSGDITGILDIYDSDDNSGAYVSLKGTNIKTTTDYEGRWTLTNVEPGVYDIIFSKSGYDTTECYGFPFPGNGTMYCYALGPISWATKVSYSNYGSWKLFKYSNNHVSQLYIDNQFTKDTTWYDDGHGDSSIERIDTILYFHGKLDYEGPFIIFKNIDINVSKENLFISLPAQWSHLYSYNYDVITNTFKFGIFYWYFNKYLGGSSTKVYMIAYPGDFYYEIDLRNDKQRWLGLGEPSEIVEFTIPNP